jgi:hypothetical protein
MGISGPTSRINKINKINMLQTEKRYDNAGGSTSDLLSSIYKIEIHNEEKISDADRIFCENQQNTLYRSLDKIDHWYGIFVEEAAQYKDSYKISYEPNGKIKFHEPYNSKYDYVEVDFTKYEFKPFEVINKLVEENYKAVSAFAKSIVSYFNRNYEVSVPYPDIDEATLQMGFRPLYQSYVDLVIEHLGGRSFRDTAEEELVNRFLDVVSPGRWSKVKPELKKDKIIFPDVIWYDNFWPEKNKIEYESRRKLENFCAGIAYGADDSLQGSLSMVIWLNCDNVDVSRPYGLSSVNAQEMKFFKNRRIDVRFKDTKTAEACFHKLKLDAIEL